MAPRCARQLDGSWWYPRCAETLPDQRHQRAGCAGKGCRMSAGIQDSDEDESSGGIGWL